MQRFNVRLSSQDEAELRSQKDHDSYAGAAGQAHQVCRCELPCRRHDYKPRGQQNAFPVAAPLCKGHQQPV